MDTCLIENLKDLSTALANSAYDEIAFNALSNEISVSGGATAGIWYSFDFNQYAKDLLETAIKNNDTYFGAVLTTGFDLNNNDLANSEQMFYGFYDSTNTGDEPFLKIVFDERLLSI